MLNPGPAKTWVFVDEHPQGINDGWFAVDMGGYDPISPNSYTIVDFPASYHNRACGFSFADSHSEIKKWLDGLTKQPVQYIDLPAIACKNSRDYAWVIERTVAARPH